MCWGQKWGVAAPRGCAAKKINPARRKDEKQETENEQYRMIERRLRACDGDLALSLGFSFPSHWTIVYGLTLSINESRQTMGSVALVVHECW